MSEDSNQENRISDRMKSVPKQIRRVPERVRRMPEHMKRVPVKQAAQASGSVALWLSIFALFLIAIIVSMGRWWAPLYVEIHRTELLGMISEASGVELVSDDMTLVWSRWGPRLQLTGLRVRGENGEIPASLDQAQFSANVFKTMMLGKLIIDDVEVEGLHLDVLRSKEGKWRLALTSEERPEQEGVDWFDVLNRFRWLNLKNSVITFRDQKRQRQYVVEGVTVVANHFDDQYRIKIDGDLPSRLGEKLHLIANLKGDSSDTLSGQLYLNLKELNFAELGSAIGEEKTQMSGRLQQLEYWQQFTQGRANKGQLLFAGKNLELKRVDEGTTWAVDEAVLALGWERENGDWDVWLDNLMLAADGEAWRSGYTRFKRSADGTVRAQGEQLRLGTIGLFLAQLSNIDSLQKIAQAAEQYSPRGELVSWKLLLDPPDEQGRLNPAFEGVVSGLHISSVDDRPGIHGLDALLRIKNKQLSFRVNSSDVRFEAPKLFKQPLQFDHVSGIVTAKLDPVNWWVRSAGLNFEVDGAEAKAVFDVSKPEDSASLALNIHSDFKNIDAAMIPMFYPVGIMQPSLTHWLTDSIHKGRVRSGTFELRGQSQDFPFREGDGIMRANFAVEGLELDYSPGWPLVTEVGAEITITGTGLTVAGEGNFDGAPIENFTLDIPDFRNGLLYIEGELDSSGEAIKRFASKGPLASTLATYFDGMLLEGPVRLKLSPVVSIKNPEQSTIEGMATLKGARVEIGAAGVDLHKVYGELPFDENGLKNSQLKGQLYGRPLKAQLKRLSNQRGLQIDARAEISPSNWLKQQDIPLGEYLTGTSQWRALVRILNGQKDTPGITTVSLTSDMQGVKILAPYPIEKGQSAQRPFHIEGRIDASNSSEWSLDFGRNIGAKFILNTEGELKSLALGAGQPVPTMPQEGVRLRVDWASADIAKWYDLIDNCCLQGEGDGGYLDVYAEVARAQWYGTPIGGGSLELVDDEDGLKGRIDSKVASGNFHYNYRVGEEAWDFDLHRVNLTAFTESEESTVVSDALDPRTVPITRWKIDNLQLSDTTVKDIKINTSPVDEGMRVDRIIISTSDYTGSGKGLWQLLENGEHSSEIEMFLHANDLGRAIESVGRGGAITGGRGQITLNLLWHDALYQPDIATLSGTAKLEMSEGRINDVDPGAGRVFGLLALQTLPRRLTLDFSDLQEGMSYTQVKGEFELADGLAKTRYLVLEGPIGTVSVTGTIDYVNQRFDEKIVVLPNVGGALPLIGAVMGGPVTAAGVFVADKILKAIGLNVNTVGRRDYTLTGTFDDPVFD